MTQPLPSRYAIGGPAGAATFPGIVLEGHRAGAYVLTGLLSSSVGQRPVCAGRWSGAPAGARTRTAGNDSCGSAAPGKVVPISARIWPRPARLQGATLLCFVKQLRPHFQVGGRGRVRRSEPGSV